MLKWERVGNQLETGKVAEVSWEATERKLSFWHIYVSSALSPSPTVALVPCPLFQNDQIIQQPADFLMLIDNYMNAATSFIKQQAGEWLPPVAFYSSSIAMFCLIALS